MTLNDHKPPRRRWRFSLATLLTVITVAAVILGAWKYWSYRPPTDGIASYEKATGTRRSWMDVGPNRIRLATIARNDRDGTLHVEDGEHQAANQSAVPDASVLAAAGPWLDVAEIRLSPGLEQLDIIDARIFDHRTRARISDSSEAYGWRVVDRNVVQVYGLGVPLPESLDLWFRLNSYAAGSSVAKLGTSVGSTCTLDGGTFTVQDIRSGQWPYNSKSGFTQPAEYNDDALSLLLTFQGGDSETQYQIVAVSTSGETSYSSMPHFLRFQKQAQKRPIDFDVGLKELDHFELRPFGGRHTFFFDSVALPKISASAFTPPPKVKVAINGQEISQKLSTFAPLGIKIATYRGDEFSGSMANESRGSLIRRNSNQNDGDKETTVAKWTWGLSPKRWNLRYLDAKNRSVLWGNHSTGFGSYATGGAAYENFGAPLEQLGVIEVSLSGPPSSSPIPGSQPKVPGKSK